MGGVLYTMLRYCTIYHFVYTQTARNMPFIWTSLERRDDKELRRGDNTHEEEYEKGSLGAYVTHTDYCTGRMLR